MPAYNVSGFNGFLDFAEVRYSRVTINISYTVVNYAAGLTMDATPNYSP